MSPSPQARLVSNTLWNGVGRVTTVLVGLFLTPYILARVGQERFGLWALANLLIGYFSLADLGIQSSLVRQIAYAQPHRNPTKLSEIVSTSFFFYLGAFVVAAPASLFLGPWLVHSFRELSLDAMPDHMIEEGTFVVTFVAATLFLSIALAVFTSIFPGVQRMDRANQVVIITSLANLGTAVFVLEKGWGVRGLVVASLAVKLVNAVANHQVSRRLYPSLELALRHVKWPVWKELLSFGWKIQVARLAETLALTFDRLFLSLVGGVGLLGRYQPAVQVTTHSRILPHLLISAALPYASELSAQNDRVALTSLYLRGTLYLTTISYALLGLVTAAAPFLTTMWLGPGYADVALWIRILCVGYVINAPLSLGGLLTQAIGRPGIQARSALMVGGLNFVLAPLGFFLAGITGLAIGSTASLVVASIWFFGVLHRTLGLSSMRVIRFCYQQPALYMLLPAAMLGFIGDHFMAFAQSRYESLFVLFAMMIVMVPLCLLGATRMDLWKIRAHLAR